MAFAKPIFTKLANAEQQYVQISCTEFDLNWTISTESTDINRFLSVSKVWFSHRQFLRNSQTRNTLLWAIRRKM
jgi:hypothetical protein